MGLSTGPVGSGSLKTGVAFSSLFVGSTSEGRSFGLSAGPGGTGSLKIGASEASPVCVDWPSGVPMSWVLLQSRNKVFNSSV